MRIDKRVGYREGQGRPIYRPRWLSQYLAYFVKPHHLPNKWDNTSQDSPETSVTSDAIDANVTIITRKNDLSTPQQSNVCSNSMYVW